MNITDLRESDFATKQEGNSSTSDGKIISNKPTFTTSSWSRLKDPRIVRVSRAFGGKDRHSKVCTVRGLRDRRVRLSVPTAIQLYDLQDRLGLNQPSKVVDWLLNAAKHEIDELPPLQMPPGNLGQNLQAMLSGSNSSHLGVINASSSEKFEGVKTSTNSLNWEDYWNPDKSKEVARETSDGQEGGEQEEGNLSKHDDGTFVQSSNFFGARSNQPAAGLLNNVIPNGSFIRWDPSNLSLSQFGSYGSMASHHQTEDAVHNFNMNVAALPSIPSGSKLLVYPTPPQTQSYFPSHDNSGEFDPKQLNFQMLSSSSSSQQPMSSSSNFTPPLYMINQGMRPFHLSMNPKLFPSGDVNQPNKGN